MGIIDRVRERATAALGGVRERAEREAWDQARVEREKSLFELEYEVTLCAEASCWNLVHPIPGFRDLRCKDHGG